VPTLARLRDGRILAAFQHFPAEAVRNCTNLAVIVYANERDHVQAAPDHGHILIQVEGFRQPKARFVRLNPDRSYVERMVASRLRLGPGFVADPARAKEALDRFPNNSAGKAFDRSNIAMALEPTQFPVALYMQAAVYELADRTQARHWAPNLDAVLYPNALWQPLPRPLGRGPGPR